MRPKTLRPFVLALLVLLSSCGLLAKGDGDLTTVTITPAADGKQHSLSAAAVVVPADAFAAAAEQAGAGFRTGGERKGIRVRYCVLDPAAEESLLKSLGVTGNAFSPAVGLALGDEGQIRTQGREPYRGYYALHLQTRGSGTQITRLEIGIVARPSDGSLLPVIRAGIPVTGSGTYLITCESGSGAAFGVFLRLEIAGSARAGRTQSNQSHRLTTRSFTVKTRELSRILRLQEIEERGGPGGLVLETLQQDEMEPLAKALRESGTVGPGSQRPVNQSATASVRAGGLSLAIRSTFFPSTARYTTVVTVQNRGELPPLTAIHGERDVLLLLGWGAESPGMSTAALLELTPVD